MESLLALLVGMNLVLAAWQALKCFAADTTGRSDAATVLVIRVYSDDRGRRCHVTGPHDGDYLLSDAVYAASVLTANCVEELDQGTERGLEIVAEGAMHVLRDGGTAEY